MTLHANENQRVGAHRERASRRGSAAFTLVEAVVSLAVLSVSMMAFLMCMRSSVVAGREEFAETDVQTKTRELSEDLLNQIKSARIRYLSPGTAVTLGAPIYSLDTDNNNASFLLLQYQIPAVKNTLDGSTDYTGALPQFGAVAPGDVATTDGAWYALVFRVERLINESDPTIGKDLDGDGALTTTFAVGRIEQRYYDPPFVAGPGGLAKTYAIDKFYPGLALIEYDTATSSPKATTFKWVEALPASVDGVYHVTSPAMVYKPVLNNGRWNPLLAVQMRFLSGTNDSSRIKLVSVNQYLPNQGP